VRNWLVMMKLASTCPNSDMGVVWGLLCLHPNTIKPSYYYSSLYSPFFLRHMNLTTADLRNYLTEFHETWWSYRYMFLVGPKVFSFVVKGVKVIF
jgi:hypothetical protein